MCGSEELSRLSRQVMKFCPFRNECRWYDVMGCPDESSIFCTDCDEHFEDCLVYRVCMDSKDFRECSRCLFETPTSQLNNPAILEACKQLKR